MVVSLPATMIVSNALYLLKGSSSHEIFQWISFVSGTLEELSGVQENFTAPSGMLIQKPLLITLEITSSQQTTIDRFLGAS